MFGLPTDAEVICPHCRRVMVDLASLDDAAGRDAAGNSTGSGYASPRNAAGSVFLFFGVIDVIMDILFSIFHRRKVKRLCQTVLPQWPKSLVCASCLFVMRRK